MPLRGITSHGARKTPACAPRALRDGNRCLGWRRTDEGVTLLKHLPRFVVVMVLLWIGAPSLAFAQDEGRVYAGALVGVSTLSADARASTRAGRAEVSLYKPENGPALNLFVGVHLGRYFTVQTNYVWNRNDLTLFASVAAPELGGFYEQSRASTQHALVGDALLYFRALGSGVRPYLQPGPAWCASERAGAARGRQRLDRARRRNRVVAPRSACCRGN